MEAEVKETTEDEKQQNLRDLVWEEKRQGNVVISTIDGLMKMSLAGIVKQPVEGILYDINRDEMTITTFLDDPKWINDFASSQVIRELYGQVQSLTLALAAEKARVEALEQAARRVLEELDGLRTPETSAMESVLNGK